MVVTTRPIGEALGTIVGRDGIRDDADARSAAAVDGQEPRWVVRPASIDQLSRVVALAHDEKLSVVPRGRGSALELGIPPARVDLVVDLGGLDRVVEYNPDDLTVTVQAGISAGALAALLAPRRQFLPLDPPGATGRTLGGITATNASGPLRFRYGTMRDLLLGVRFVQADGVVTWGGSKVVKSVSGYDVPKLMVGALGTLGVLVELTFRLHPMPDREGTWLITLASAPAAQAFIALVLDSTLEPMRFELLNAPALQASSAPSAPVGVAVSIGSVEGAVREQGAQLEELARRAGGRATALEEDFWDRCDRAFTTAAGEVVLQIGVLPSLIAQTLEAITAGQADLRSGATPMVTGCVARGSIRVVL